MTISPILLFLARRAVSQGLPDYAYEEGYGYGGIADADAYGAAEGASFALPNAPDWKSGRAVRAYLAEAWRRLGPQRGSAPKAVGLVVARILRSARAKSGQTAAADAVRLGPPLAAPGAAEWYTLVRSAQAAIRAVTQEEPEAALPGQIAASAAARLSRSARGVASSTGLSAATRGQAASLADGMAALARAPADVARAAASVPVGVAQAAGSVPTHLAHEVGETARSYIDAVKDTAPILAAALTDSVKEASDAGGRAGFGLGAGLAIGGGVLVGGVLLYQRGPALVAQIGARARR